jgi:hypothetical protein
MPVFPQDVAVKPEPLQLLSRRSRQCIERVGWWHRRSTRTAVFRPERALEAWIANHIASHIGVVKITAHDLSSICFE